METWEKTRKAKIHHKCEECYDGVKPGETYHSYFSVDGGDKWAWKMCDRCRKAVEWLTTRPTWAWDDEYTIGSLWNSICEYLGDGPIPMSLNPPRFITHRWQVWLTPTTWMTRYSGKPGVSKPEWSTDMIDGHDWISEEKAREAFGQLEDNERFPGVEFREVKIREVRE